MPGEGRGSGKPYGPRVTATDDAELTALGYRPSLERSVGRFEQLEPVPAGVR